MKTFKHLFEKAVDPGFIEGCILTAAEHKRKRRSVQAVVKNRKQVANLVSEELKQGIWEPPLHKKTILREGAHKKERVIEKPVFYNEQIVHHVIINTLKPILKPRFYELACGCVPGRGPKLAMTTMTKWVKSYHGRRFYVAELDIKKFYEHIDHDILKNQLAQIIKDDRFLDLCAKVIDGSSGSGLPLGYYTSPWFGNYYLTGLDRYILHTLGPEHYLRYMDNIFLFDIDKEYLHEIVQKIMKYCAEELKLEIKKDWQVFQFEEITPDPEPGEHFISGRAINCLGFVIHRNRVTLRKALLKRIRAKAFRMHKRHQCTLHDAQAMVSYSGWLQNADAYEYYLKFIRPNVSVAYCKRVISKISKQKRSNKNDRLENSAQHISGEAKCA